MIDLRSDTVTKPSIGMRKAMAEAEVGDDSYREDPTVNRLEERVAEMLGMEAALFVPSGTMANQAVLMAHTRPGDEIIIERTSHLPNYEAGGLAALAGVQTYLIDGDRRCHRRRAGRARRQVPRRPFPADQADLDREHPQSRWRKSIPARQDERGARRGPQP